ncbi:diguanylate cyclase (GGDEF)-like protein/PAS domain S-box-containing protein [Halomonas fontilapidosi]|uniref:Diguanylate cyclase (GGDEF)-like protein/PAS domain S-box-containing protein n=1 Tax=Halomonas fontilapidosi TaxID=616675 RepID=A0A7W5DHW3_9GAMM|nr:bifunctional diguanylate cyclase/phosphodiesterase [Halomonas fontilapidosi]MBB3182850.1 diguanylate cyclase (GGDEF)-like protein/PAS domain S-box-containing protein [Halomonas fontilapidosi]
MGKDQADHQGASSGTTWHADASDDLSQPISQSDQLRLMAAAFETGQATIITDERMRIRRVNKAFTRITGFTPDDVLGHTPRMFKSGRHGPRFYQRLWGTLLRQGHWQGEIWNRNKQGEIYPVWQSITAVKDDDDRVRHYVSVFHDIAERKRVEHTLAQEASRDHLTGAANRRTFDRALIKSVRVAGDTGGELSLMFLDIDHFKAVNDNHGHDIGDATLHALTQLIQQRLRKRDLLARWGGEEFTLLLPDTPLQGACQLAERLRADVAGAAMPGPGVTISFGLTAFQGGDSARDMIQRADGALYRAKRGGRNRVEVDPEYGVAETPTSAQEAESPSRPRFIDEYRGASRRMQLASRLEEALALASHHNGTLAVCSLDVDHFKNVNEQLGNALADRLVLALIQRINRSLGRDDLIVRMGGDELVVIRHNVTDDTTFQALLETIRQPFHLAGRSVTITASLGVASFPMDDVEADVLLRHAQQAMYRAKQNGRNTLAHFNPRQDKQVQRCQAQRRRIEQAILCDELCLHYQPQVDMATAKVVGFEALVRWQHPEEGLLGPGEFLPLTEGTWLEILLGEWVLKAVLEQLACWQGEGNELPVSVNISPAHLLAPDFVTQLSGLLATMPAVSPSRLKLEVVETAAMQDIAAALKVISHCQAMGVEVAIDDFGTGFSSLTYLRQLPVDLIKVDKSFVRDMLEDTSDRAIVESIIYMAKRFNRALLAEGVESIDHATELLRLGCHLAQGFGIARPMPADALQGWLAQWPKRREWQGLVASAVEAVTGETPSRSRC